MNFAELRPYLSFGLLVLLLLWETLRPFFPFPRGRTRLVHGGRNLLLGISNGLITALLFAGLWWAAADISAERGFGLLHRFSWHPHIGTVIALLLLDVWTYTWHRLNHRIPLLWRFHRVHHSDPHMDVTTASRFHAGEIVLSSILRIPLIFLLGVSAWQLALYEVLLFAVVQFHHANVGLGEKVDRVLSWFIVTPFLHKVHHSHWQPETDSNYASLLSIWDRIFRTFRFPNDPSGLRLGLDEFASPRTQSLGGMLRTPLAPTRPPETGKTKSLQ
jgi:sterol desaturase/sphingolipid hydroxylase (fatty acid hydroxylase superfamily)